MPTPFPPSILWVFWGQFPVLNGLLFSSQSLIKRMAQSVVEVMEDAKGKVQENLLANGGRSPASSYSSAFSAHLEPWLWPHSSWIDTGPMEALNWHVRQRLHMLVAQQPCYFAGMPPAVYSPAATFLKDLAFHLKLNSSVKLEVKMGSVNSNGWLGRPPSLSASTLSRMENSSTPNRFILPRTRLRNAFCAEECLKLKS